VQHPPASESGMNMTIVLKTYLGTVNTVDCKPILKCLIFRLFYFHPTTCFDLSKSSSVGFYELHICRY
jgi:hypothetical protein